MASLLLLLTANGAPIIASNLFKDRGAWQVDGGRRFVDRQPIFGKSKTWRGIAASVVSCTVVALLLGLPALVGVLFGAFAMGGDLLSSFVKRRLNVPPSGRMTGLDQLPEALLPLILLQQPLALEAVELVAAVAIFFFLEVGLSRWLYRWHIRERPY